MYSKILISVSLDHETLVSRKIDVARTLLAEGGRITLLTCLEDVPGFVAEFVTVKSPNHLSNKIKEALDKVAAGAPDIDTAVVTGKAGIRIAEFAQDNGNDLIVVGSHHPNATDYFLGSTAARVARRAHCSVLILR